MNVFKHYFVLGFALLIMCTNQNCKANTVAECPNMPITPYPPTQTSNPTLPLSSGIVQPTNLCHITINQNQQVLPGAVPLTNPCQTACTQNSPNLCQIIYGQNVCQHYNCHLPSLVCCPSQTSPCQITTTTSPLPTTTSLPPTTTSTNLPPANIIMCPSGTILLGESCHVIYCPSGSVMKNDRCMFIKCPEGTIWTGHSCSEPEPIVQNFTFNSTLTTYVNKTTSDIIFNSNKNIVVNLLLTVNDDNNNNINCSNDIEDCQQEIAKETTTSQKCCEVLTPRICKKRSNGWHCYSRRSRRCGDFCIAPIIYLKPPRIYAGSNYVVLPPIQRDCDNYEGCAAITGGHDCSGCAMNNMLRCSHYCYRYSCPSHKCKFFDHQKYCSDNVGIIFGCQEVDGCYGDWCLDN